jgi:hypothetical protein
MRGPSKFEEPLCAEVGGDFWFPEKGDPEHHSQFAKSICSKCKHKVECLEWALENESVGIWGGLNERTRNGIKARRRKKIA